MALSPSAEAYLQALAHSKPRDHGIHVLLSSSPSSTIRVYHSSAPDVSRPSPSAVLEQAKNDAENTRPAVCMIENVSREWIGILGSEWNIDPAFFTMHAENPSGSDLWNSVVKQRRHNDGLNDASAHEAKTMYCIDGVLNNVRSDGIPVHRRSAEHPSYALQTNVRITYRRVARHLCEYSCTPVDLCSANGLRDLFLVDRPIRASRFANGPTRLNLWVGYSRNRGGMPVPQLYTQDHFSMFDMLVNFFSHGWHVSLMQPPTRDPPPATNGTNETKHALRPDVLVYILAASLWKSNLQYVGSRLEQVAFGELRRPTLETNDRLHDLRQDLHTIRKRVKLTKAWVPKAIEKDTRFQGTQHGPKHLNPLLLLDEVLADIEVQDRFLMDTFQLLMSSISVLDARRGARLTQLATIYVPLSFVTGIYGMNVREINGSSLSVWTTAVALVVTAALTALILWAMMVLPDPTATRWFTRKLNRPK